MLNDVECTTFKMFLMQVSNYLFVISFQLMFYKTLHYRLAQSLGCDFVTSLSPRLRNHNATDDGNVEFRNATDDGKVDFRCFRKILRSRLGKLM